MIRVNKSFSLYRTHPTKILWGAMILLLTFLMLRSGGIYPVVFSDEWSYSSYSRLLPLQEAALPSYLYLSLFRITNVCGDGFLDCARTLNNILITLTAPVIYAIARRVCSPWPAAITALLSVAGPFNTYAIYFMPEATYFAGFWMLTWFVLTQHTQSPARLGLLLGTLLGLLSLVKIHALFLLPGIACYGIYFQWRSGHKNWQARGAATLLLMGLAFSATKLMLGYLFAGKSGITLFGTLYSAQADTANHSKQYVDLAINAATNLTGHGMALALMFGLPITAMLTTRIRRSEESAPTEKLAAQDLVVYTSLVLIPLLVIVGYFTASVAGSGPYENLSRLHMRYYNFAFPLLILIAASQLRAVRGFQLDGSTTAVIVALIAGYGMWRLLPDFTPSMVDSPELRGLTLNPTVYHIIAAAGTIITITWIFNARRASQIFLFGLLPVMTLGGSWQVGAEVRNRQVIDAYDEAGLFAKRYLGPAVSSLAVVGPEPAALSRTLFHIDNANVKSVQHDVNAPLDFTTFPTGIDWLLLIGDYDLPVKHVNSMSMGKYMLVSMHKNYHVDMKQSYWPGVLTRTRGLSSPEAWGTWSIAREVQLEFASYLPSHFRISLDAQAFGPNINEEFQIIIGNEHHSFHLEREPKTVSFDFSAAANERIVRIIVPHPTAPMSLGINDDVRKLGIGLSQVHINPLNFDQIN